MAPAQSSAVSMEGLRGACVSPPEVSGADAEPVAANLEEDAACFWWTRGWRCLKKCVPVDFWKEVVQLLKLAGPVAISQLMVFFINFISTVFCGHIGDTELAGVAMAVSLINVLAVSISTGLSAACDTLISQTYGSGNLKRVGVILQRGVLILLLACFPCCAVLLNTEPILLLVRQSPKVAHVAQVYVNTFLPCLPAVFLFQLQGRYLQNQGIIWPQVVTGAIGNVLNAILNGIFLYVLDLGVVGSAAANAFSQYFLAVFLFILIYCTGLHKSTWSGWSMDCLQDWGMFIRVAIPSMVMVCMEWWTFEIGGILAGLIGEVELGAQAILHQMITILYTFALGMGIAGSTRVGNALGAGNVVQAVSAYKAAIICTLVVSCAMGLILGASKDVVGYIFTTEKKIIERVAETTLICAFLHPADAMLGVTSGIMRGAGKQRIGAICNLVGYYAIGLPIAVSLMFAAKLGIVGLWSGLFICVLLQALLFNIILWKLNWKKAAEEAKVRAGVQVKESKETMTAARGESQANIVSSNIVKHEEFSSDQDALQQSQDETVNAAESPALSVTQLLLRRGLAALLMVFILGAGILINKIVIKLLK